MAKGYVRMAPVSPLYELVQLLRLNGVHVVRGRSAQHVKVQLAKGMQAQVLSIKDLKRRFGPGTAEYQILLKHPRASTIIKAPEASLA